MKEATAKKAALDAKAEPNNYMKQKNSLKLNAQNAGVSQEAEVHEEPMCSALIRISLFAWKSNL